MNLSDWKGIKGSKRHVKSRRGSELNMKLDLNKKGSKERPSLKKPGGSKNASRLNARSN